MHQSATAPEQQPTPPGSDTADGWLAPARFAWILGALIFAPLPAAAGEIFIRASQIGYRPGDRKSAIVFAKSTLPNRFEILTEPDRAVVFTRRAGPTIRTGWGQFGHHVELDFSDLPVPGTYRLRMADVESAPFGIDDAVFSALPEALLEFMRQQRCGSNPWLGAQCHTLDGRTAYGPRVYGSQLDARGGWHDAADLLKYLLTSGNATAQMFLAHELLRTPTTRVQTPRSNDAPETVNDQRARPEANGVPDLLEEARWGVEWMLKLHPAPDELYHQVGDDRDHIGMRLPQNEVADYGWGKGGARVVYYANGRPQGLGKYQSASTGVANLAGRYAAAMALAYQAWRDVPLERAFAQRCLQAGKEVYEMGRTNEGVQQGNSNLAPYRYEEATWADDMEWGAAELFRATREHRYLEEAMRYALMAGAESWMGKEQTRHYEYYPFMNLGHFRLAALVDRPFQRRLAAYYRTGIEACVRAGRTNPYRVGVPFIWCSNNLTVALATQCLLYERMTNDRRYAHFAACQRDWLLGRNPWGYCMFTGLGDVWPRNPHLMTTYLTGRPIRGGLVDGPVYERIFKSLRGVAITEPDPLAAFQGPAVFHDDRQDYSSNEPTMDGTASAILLWALCSTQP